MSSGWNNDYAGDINAAAAFELLGTNPRAQIVDVRTRPEWTFVGVPDLSALNKEVILVEWQHYPAMEVATDFTDTVARELSRLGTGTDDPVIFLCRSGIRSLAAAKAMAAAGWRLCHNVTGGFEGPLDSGKHRGTTGGWKVGGLPWIQS